MNRISIMAHLVAGYPHAEGWEQAARALSDSGVDMLEIQIPFSDPTADGPVITHASQEALRSGFRIKDIFAYIQRARDFGFSQVYLMTYANIVYRYGIRRYLEEMANREVTGVIVPDFPLEDEEGFFQTAREIGIDALPVAVSTMTRQRIDLLNSFSPRRIYAALRQGVTGRSTDITDDSRRFLRSLYAPFICAGFGISTRLHVEALQGYAHAAVIGSHITRAISKGEAIYDQVKEAIDTCIPG